jgi:hypothetical protein
MVAATPRLGLSQSSGRWRAIKRHPSPPLPASSLAPPRPAACGGPDAAEGIEIRGVYVRALVAHHLPQHRGEPGAGGHSPRCLAQSCRLKLCAAIDSVASKVRSPGRRGSRRSFCPHRPRSAAQSAAQRKLDRKRRTQHRPCSVHATDQPSISFLHVRACRARAVARRGARHLTGAPFANARKFSVIALDSFQTVATDARNLCASSQLCSCPAAAWASVN